MKLIKEFGRKYNDAKDGKKIYYKYKFIIPNKIIKQLDLKGGEEFTITVKGKKMIIEKK